MLFIKDIPVLLSILFILLCENAKELNEIYVREHVRLRERERERPLQKGETPVLEVEYI